MGAPSFAALEVDAVLCSLFGGKSSDLDLCVRKRGKVNAKGIIHKLAYWLRQARWCEDVNAIAHARVPLVSFKHADTGFECDIVVNNELAIYNTQLLKTYGPTHVQRAWALVTVPLLAQIRACG